MRRTRRVAIAVVVSRTVAGDCLAGGIAIVRDRGSAAANDAAVRALLRLEYQARTSHTV